MRKKALVSVSALLAVAAVFLAAFMGARLGAEKSPETAAVTAAAEEAEPKDASQSIIIPGYDEIRLKAHEKEQAVYFYNPAENPCFFVISLKIDDTEIYRSEMLAPDTKIESISISEPLYRGSYGGAVISYACYDLYTQQELNGAEIAVKLEVE